MNTPTDNSFRTFWVLSTIFFTSIAVIFLQIVLMQALTYISYYHFTYVIISNALLGFGCSGTILAFKQISWNKHYLKYTFLIQVLFVFSIPFSYFFSNMLPLDIQYVLYSPIQIGYFILLNLLLFLPFLLGGIVVGFHLSFFQRNSNIIYGINLIGSGIGGTIALLALFSFSPEQLPQKTVVFACIALLSQFFSERKSLKVIVKILLFGVLLLGCIGLSYILFFYEPNIPIDQYKSLAHMRRLEEQGKAKHLAESYSPLGRIDVYFSNTIHHTLFASPQTDVLPPPQNTLYINGEKAAPIFRIEDKEECQILKHVPQSLPYRFHNDANVLLLGETGGTNIWLAKLFNAKRITVVQKNPQITTLMHTTLSDQGGHIFAAPNVTVINQDPRHFLETTEEKFDIIQLSSAEVMPIAAGTVGSLYENFLLTKESIKRCIEVLSSRGILSVTRGMHMPPRDNVKIFALFAEALQDVYSDVPFSHILQSKNYLAVNTLLFKPAITQNQKQQYQNFLRQLSMEQLFPSPLESEPTEAELSFRAQENPTDYFALALNTIASGENKKLYTQWAYRIAPPNDNSPYFSNFFKWDSLSTILSQYGKHWFHHIELGYIFIVFTIAVTAVFGFLLILLPLFFRQTKLMNVNKKFSVFLYFFSIGIGFMFLEMILIQKLTFFLGSPIYSAGVVLIAIMIFSGIGSLFSKKNRKPATHNIHVAATYLITFIFLYSIVLDMVLELFMSNTVLVQIGVSVVVLFPLCFFLGWFLPSGIAANYPYRASLIPWAWGINGFASVIATPLAVLLSIEIGFTAVLYITGGMYLIAGLCSLRFTP